MRIVTGIVIVLGYIFVFAASIFSLWGLFKMLDFLLLVQ